MPTLRDRFCGGRHGSSASRRNSPELCFIVPPSNPGGRREGRVLTSHPRSTARNAHAGRTAQQHTGGADHSAFPARWSDGLCRDLPGAELSSGLPRRSNWTMPSARLGSRASSIRLDRSNDGQDHTVLPYARPAISPQYSRPCTRNRKLTDETNLAAPFVCTKPRTHRDYPPCPLLSCRRCRVHRTPGSRSRRPRDRPSW